MTASRVTLDTGEEVDTASPQWREECLRRHRHVVSMRSLDLQGRREYLASVERAEGDESRRRTAEAYAADWAHRRAEGTK